MRDHGDPLDRYVIDPVTGCWEYSGGRDKDGYGKFKKNGKNVRAHRASYEKNKGPLLEDDLVCHSCDNPPCINPEHLFVGDHAVNHADRGRKGRQAKGSCHGRSKITEQQAIQLRLERPGERFAKEALGLSRTQYYRILRGEQWSELHA